MTAHNKQALREAAEKATPGEWKRMMRNSDELMTTFHGVAIGNVFVELTTGKRDIFDAEFIAAANPATVLALLDELEAAEKRIAELRDWNAGLAQESFTYQQKVAELEARPANPINFKENADADYCRGWAWNEVKKELSPEDWTVGDNCTYYGFFCWGWDSRRQFNEQRAAGIGVKGE